MTTRINMSRLDTIRITIPHVRRTIHASTSKQYEQRQHGVDVCRESARDRLCTLSIMAPLPCAYIPLSADYLLRHTHTNKFAAIMSKFQDQVGNFRGEGPWRDIMALHISAHIPTGRYLFRIVRNGQRGAQRPTIPVQKAPW